MPSYLLILGEREAVAWVLRHQRMAFPARRRAEVERLTVGDELFVFTTRGCWHNPTRDRGRIIGRARVDSSVQVLDTPVSIAGREFATGCGVDVLTLTPYRTGVELAPLVHLLEAFPDKVSWSVRLRRPLLQLPDADASLLRYAVTAIDAPAAAHVRDYLDKIKPVVSQSKAARAGAA